MRLQNVILLLLAAPLAAQTPSQRTAEDYARAERFLGATTAPLVTGSGIRPIWLEDGRLWYRTTLRQARPFTSSIRRAARESRCSSPGASPRPSSPPRGWP
jgi:hypothetical protein